MPSNTFFSLLAPGVEPPKGAEAVARVSSSGPDDGHLLYVFETEDDDAVSVEGDDDGDEPTRHGPKLDQRAWYKALEKLEPRPRLRAKMMQELQAAAHANLPPSAIRLELEPVYRAMLKETKTPTAASRVVLNVGSTFVPLVTTTRERNTWYISSEPGGGKSVFAANLARQFHLAHPDDPVVLVTEMESDPAFDSLPYVKRLPPKVIAEAEEAGEPLDVNKDFGEGAFLIGDDIDALDKRVLKPVMRLLISALALGRKKRLSVAVTTHVLNASQKTKEFTSQSESVVLFPRHTLSQQLVYFCTKIGLSPKQIQRLRRFGSRWLLIHKTSPKYVIAEHRAEILQ